jgi:invasion protein IalB
MRYQRTKGSTVLREQMKKQYRTVKAEYAQTINKEKYESWKKFCTLTPANNPWNGIYRIAASKRKQIQLTTTLRKKDGTMTKDLQETIKYTLEKKTRKLPN